MKRAMVKRITAIALSAVLALGVTSCGKGSGGNSGSNEPVADGKLFADGTNISIVIGSHSSWPYNENWAVWKYFSEATGATFDIQAIPNTDIDTKVNLIMASPETLPDLLHVISKASIETHAMAGAFVSLSANKDKMPSFVKFMDSLPEEQSRELMLQRTSGDGEVYFAPVYGTETVQNLRTWMYRKDIFEKNNLKVPATLDELYDVSVQLKKLYPESYPLCFRNGLTQIDVMSPIWKNDFSYLTYYDFKENKWGFGASEDTMKDVIAFFHKMSDAKLVPPDFLTIASKSWEELVSTDRGFIMPEYLVRLDYFNLPNRTKNPDYTWAIMEPPASGSALGGRKIAKLNMDPTGYLICNTGKQDRIDNAFKLLDWMYSDEGSELLAWGKEGETYKVVDGKKEFILNADETAQSRYGINTYGVLQRTTPESYEAGYSKEQSEQAHVAYTYTEDHVNPSLWLAFNDEERAVFEELYASIKDYTDESLSHFILKTKPMSEWDNFQKGLKEMGLDRLMEVYESAYARATGK